MSVICDLDYYYTVLIFVADKQIG